MTVKFTDVYAGDEHVRLEAFDVPAPPGADDGCDAIDDWALDYIFPRTGDGYATNTDAGYFAEIVDCAQRPDLVGRQFEWV